jgi:phage terminase large subunit GpA-like protein
MAYLEPIERAANQFWSVFQPPPDLSVSEWANDYLYLSPEDSSEPGKFRVDRAPYQRGMMDAVSDSSIKEIVYCTSSQIGKTLISKAILGYHIHQDPGPILVIQPTTEMAETFSKDRLAPMVRDTPELRGLIADPKSRNSGNTVLHKSFRGGHITMIGSNAPSGLASRPIRICFADEVDRYPLSAGTEGDPLFLARQRSVTFHNRKFIMASTPTIQGQSRIWRAFENSDQRYYFLPCVHCGEYHTLKWANMQWDEADPSSARMVCPVCGALYGDADKMRMLAAGEWRAMQPFKGVAGFHISALYSPWQRFSDVVQEWLDKKGHTETLKTFINLQLGECWEDRSGEVIDHKALAARRESWDANSIPDDIVIMTAGIDVQDDRLEISVLGWTALEQARVIEHLQLWGPPGEPQVWQELDNVLISQYNVQDGRILRIRAACIDSGGHHTQRAYEFCRSRTSRKVFPIKGKSGNHPVWPLKRSTTKLSQGVSLYMVGVDTGKDLMRSAFAVKDPEKPRYVSFAATLHDGYFPQLTAEKRHTTTNKSGMEVRTWKKAAGVRNEAGDCFVYNIAALEALKQSGLRLRAIAHTRNSERNSAPNDPHRAMQEQSAMPIARTVRKPAHKLRRTSSAVL